MPEIKANLTEKDKRYRDLALNGNLWKVTLQVGLPLALYQSLMMAFKLIDNAIAAHIDAGAVSTVAIIQQITMVISALGGGLAIGTTMKVSEAYGAGKLKLVKQRVSSVYALCAGIGILTLFICIPCSELILKLSGTPDELIVEGNNFFRVELFGTVLNFFNYVYLSIERARGNVKRILVINIVTSLIKLSFNAGFVYLLNGGVVTIAFATVISQAVFLVFALINMRGRDNAFGFSFSAIKFDRATAGITLIKSIPVIIEKMVFSAGKVIVNGMSAAYKDNTVGALSVSNNICGISAGASGGFQEAGVALISQNRGAGNKFRAIEVFKKIFVINIIIGAIYFGLTMWQLDFISSLFAGGNERFRLLIKSVYGYESFAAIALGINAASLALLYGFGLTKLSLLVNVSRVFIFRIPLLWFLQNFTDLGSESVGVVMLVSNLGVGILSAIVALIVVRKIIKNKIF
ncbi:MAG: MATE family efflux transporter [Eubacterium sp.]|jgi:putative MATE family efflux protein|nr:MATE family efflux transporter [Eubacterium sp.]